MTQCCFATTGNLLATKAFTRRLLVQHNILQLFRESLVTCDYLLDNYRAAAAAINLQKSLTNQSENIHIFLVMWLQDGDHVQGARVWEFY